MFRILFEPLNVFKVLQKALKGQNFWIPEFNPILYNQAVSSSFFTLSLLF